MQENRWYCVRQRAGPLVKECRSIRPRLSVNDTPYERTEKYKILRPPRDSSVCRTRVDRLELRLALFGYEGSVYTLTFDREHEPEKFQDVRRAWKSFCKRLRRWKERSFDYVYLIEGRHGDHRYHIHVVFRDSDFSPAEIQFLWQHGIVHDEPLLKSKSDCYRRTAEYWNKEATDGIKIPIDARTWVASQSLSRKIPPVERWRDDSGEIPVPDNVRWLHPYNTGNSFGQYRYLSYILNRNACADDI